MNKNLIKFGLGTIAMFGVDEVIGNAIKYVNPQKMNLAKKICVGVASLAISGCVAKAVNNYLDETIDEVFDFIEGIVIRKGEDCTDKPDVTEGA